MAWIFVIAGLAVVYFARQISDAAGYIDFAERWFGAGGTRTFIYLLGIIVFFLSLIYATGGFGWLIAAIGIGRIF